MRHRWIPPLVVACALTSAGAHSQSAPEAPRSAATNPSATMPVSELSPGAKIVAATLKSGLLRSRNSAQETSRPMPPEILEKLTPFFPRDLLESVRYSVGDVTPSGLAGFAIRNGNAAAVTLIDTVVFRHADYVSDLTLWAHELHHVEQYRTWGVDGFAARYAFSWTQVEAEARHRADAFRAWRATASAAIR